MADATVLKYCTQADEWTTVAPLNQARAHFSACATTGGHIYVAGGFNDSLIDSVERYDPATNEWSRVANLPDRTDSTALLESQSLLFCIGGESFKSVGVSDVYVYDPAANSWREGAGGKLRTGRSKHGGCCVTESVDFFDNLLAMHRSAPQGEARNLKRRRSRGRSRD